MHSDTIKELYCVQPRKTTFLFIFCDSLRGQAYMSATERILWCAFHINPNYKIKVICYLADRSGH